MNHTNLTLRQFQTVSFFQLISAHPYLSAFFICVIVNTLSFGAASNISSSAFMLETLGVLTFGWFLLIHFFQKNVFQNGL